jgi:hypothetical protein
MVGDRLNAMWVPLTSQNAPSTWWAVRLRSVFRLSRLAVEVVHNEADSDLPAKPTTLMLAAADLAAALRVPERVNAVDNALRRFLSAHPGCRDEIANPRKGEPRYVYRVDHVWPMLLQKLPGWRRSSPTPN